ncbi:MAG: hypothetical protein IJG32_02760 [Selenomonadaceae bacterium]|nr:hypothetical protein [Selenomonadaceae bacterium]
MFRFRNFFGLGRRGVCRQNFFQIKVLRRLFLALGSFLGRRLLKLRVQIQLLEMRRFGRGGNFRQVVL